VIGRDDGGEGDEKERESVASCESSASVRVCEGRKEGGV